MSLRSNYVMLLNELDLDAVLPIMLAERLVSENEYMVLQEKADRVTERERRDKLLMDLPRKGRDFYNLFCRCVVWSGQIELAEKMKFDVSSMNDTDKYGKNAPAVSTHSGHAPNTTVPPNYPNCFGHAPATTVASSFSIYPGHAPTTTVASSFSSYPGHVPTTVSLSFSSYPGHAPTTTVASSYSYPGPAPVTTVASGYTGHTPTTPPSSITPSPVTPAPLMSTSSAPVTENILVLYCKDQLLQTAPELPAEHRRSTVEYCQEVSDFVEILTNISSKFDQSGRVFQAYQFTYDKLAAEGTYISNHLIWSDNAISTCTTILLLCSPQLAISLSTNDGGTIEMERGMFNKNSLFSAFPQKRVIPVFLNMDKHLNWVPQPLRLGSTYSVNVKALQEGCVGVASEEELNERVSHLFRDDSRLYELCELWKCLCKERTDQPLPATSPIQVPEFISQVKLMELAEHLSFKWQELGTRLGVPLTTQQRIQHERVDSIRKTKMMFEEWSRTKGSSANKQALIDGLKGSKLFTLAKRVEDTF